MAYILNMLDLYNMTSGDEGPLLYHRSVISACSSTVVILSSEVNIPNMMGLLQHGEGDVTIRPRMYHPVNFFPRSNSPGTMGLSDDYDASLGRCGPWTMRLLEDAALGRSISWKKRPSDDVSLGRCNPRTMRLLEDAALGQYVP